VVRKNSPYVVLILLSMGATMGWTEGTVTGEHPSLTFPQESNQRTQLPNNGIASAPSDEIGPVPALHYDISKTVISTFSSTKVHFIENRGQMESSVSFGTTNAGARILYTDHGLRMVSAEGAFDVVFSEDRILRLVALGEAETRYNYFFGNQPENWITNVPGFPQLLYDEAYPGIDVVFSGDNHRLKYTFYLDPHADPQNISMSYRGIQSLDIAGDTGELIIHTGWGETRDASPIAYQINESNERVAIPASFYLKDGQTVGFSVGNYDPSRILVIDPMYSTFLGGDANDRVQCVDVDMEGNVYVAGYTVSSDFPTEGPGFGPGSSGDIFVSKFNSDGDSLLFSTIIGGIGYDSPNDIVLDENGNAFVLGNTDSNTDFPTTPSAFQTTYGGGVNDGVVLLLNATGDSLLFSTLYGGDAYDVILGAALDNEGNIHFTGGTASSDFHTIDAFQTSYAGGTYDGFVAAMNSLGDDVEFSTYFGGDGEDYGYGISVDDSGNTYVSGFTASSNLPTEYPFQGSIRGAEDAFVAKISGSDHTLDYSTYLGGESDRDRSYDVIVNGIGEAYVYGFTESDSFPLVNPYQDTQIGATDLFISKFNTDGSALLYSTYLGGSDGGEQCIRIDLDCMGNVYLTGHTYSTDFPRVNAYQDYKAGPEHVHDAFLTVLHSDGDSLLYSSYLGGAEDDYGFGVDIDNAGYAYIVGKTASSDFPTEFPYEGTFQGGDEDGFIARMIVGVTIASISPSYGSNFGGDLITITGHNFGSTQGSGIVEFDGIPASSYTSWSDTEIICTTPPHHMPGFFDVSVTTDNASLWIRKSGFQYCFSFLL